MKKEDEENSGPCTPSVPETKYVTALETLLFMIAVWKLHWTSGLCTDCDLTCAIKITCIYSICDFIEICLWKDKQNVKIQFLSSKTIITLTIYDYPDTQWQLRCHGLACSHLCVYIYIYIHTTDPRPLPTHHKSFHSQWYYRQCNVLHGVSTPFHTCDMCTGWNSEKEKL